MGQVRDEEVEPTSRDLDAPEEDLARVEDGIEGAERIRIDAPGRLVGTRQEPAEHRLRDRETAEDRQALAEVALVREVAHRRGLLVERVAPTHEHIRSQGHVRIGERPAPRPRRPGAFCDESGQSLRDEAVLLRILVGRVKLEVARHLLGSDDVCARTDDDIRDKRQPTSQALVAVVGLAVQDVVLRDAKHSVVGRSRDGVVGLLDTAQRFGVDWERLSPRRALAPGRSGDKDRQGRQQGGQHDAATPS